MRVAIYVRVSTDIQAEEGYSLDAQLGRCKAYADSQGWEVVVTYIEEGESAKDLNRTEIKRMLSDASAGLFDVLLVYRLDRLTRSVRDLHSLMDLFERQNIKFRSATELYDTTTAMGRLFINIVASLAEWERSNLGERVRFGKEQQVKEGGWPGGPVPFGYEWDGETMHLVPNEYVILRELRRLYMAGNGLRGVALALNLKGMHRRDGGLWGYENVKYTLQNPLYAQIIRFGGKDASGKYRGNRRGHKDDSTIYGQSNFPIVYTKEEYEEHIKVMNKRETHRPSAKATYWFTGVLRCSRCGSKMKGTTLRSKRKKGMYEVVMYRCYGYDRGTGCNMPMVRQVVVEDMLLKYIDGLKLSPEEVAAAKTMETESNLHLEIDNLQKEIHAISERRKKWQYMFAEDLMTEQDFRARKREEDQKEQLIQEEIDRLKAMSAGTNTEVMNYLLDLPTLWKDLSDYEKREWVQTIFDSVHIQCVQETGRFTSPGNTLDFYVKEVNFN